ncbi:MAG: LacI family DNA-binding transcriptional regulator [Gluconacetobacter diazotrophicus]|nr:LacI family DNA-binding transcriptional regulator [Gluconacetobacter diazotrophicus]
MQKPTVFEVAAAAGVSVATVDRVLNNRKGVRPGTIERVQGAVERLGFRRDAFAAGLATRRRERYLFLLPSAGTNSFMAGLHRTVGGAAARLAEQRVVIRPEEYAAFDEAALVARLRAVDPADTDGLALVGIDASAVRREIDRLAEGGLPVVTLVSDVTPSRRGRFVGIDNKAAGRVAASLIGRMAGERAGSVAIVVGQMTLHDHADRRLGFEQVIRREYPRLALLPALEGQDASARTRPMLERLLAERRDLVGIYSAGAGNRGIIAALDEAPGSAADGAAPVVVAHELTAHARDALLSGTFTAVLHQDQEQEVDGAIAALRTAVRPGMGFERGDGPIHAQIFLRDNVP